MEQTPRNFALQLGALAALYASLASLITLLFSVVTLALPDAAESYWEAQSASSSIRFAFASLVIFFPAYLVLTRYVNVIRRHATAGSYLTLTRWLMYLSLFIGGAILLGDAVAIVYSFLNGELTLRFFLKAAILAAVVKSAFFYYLMDARGYWQTHEKYSLYCGGVAIMVVLASLVLGFMYMETPSEVREQRLDEQQISDLQDMQWRIEEYYRSNEKLPEDLAVLYGEFAVPTAPENRSSYRFAHKGSKTYELCATFASDSQENMATTLAYPSSAFSKNYNWDHKAGNWCFVREIDETYRQ